MSTFASITWGIVAGYTILDVVDYLFKYVEGYLRHRRLHKILDNLDQELDELEYEFEQARPVRKKKATKRK
jgi:type III secretory pathway component EscU